MATQVKGVCACGVLALSLLSVCLLQPSIAPSARSMDYVMAASEETLEAVPETEAVNVVVEPEEEAFLAGMATVIKEGEEARAAAEAAAAEEAARIVNVAPNVEKALNIREEASEEASIVGKLYRGGIGIQQETADGWVKIQSGDVTGWVSAEYVKTGAEADQLIAEINPVVVTVNTDTLNVREKADTSSHVLAVVSSGQTFMARETGEEWIEIFYTPDIVGYVASEYVVAENKAGTAVNMETLAVYQKEAAEKEAERKAMEKKKEIAVTTNTPTLASADDTTLLAAVCQYEAGGSYEGALAVANVVLNRVRSGGYPNSIAEVIYAPGQFGGARSGALNKYLAGNIGSNARRAAEDALAGVNNVGDYTSFCSAKIADVASYSSYTMIGGNCFYRR